MTADLVRPPQTFTPRRLGVLALVAVSGAAAMVALRHGVGHAPDWALLARQPGVIHLHIAAAVAALLIGTVQLVGIKGTTAHRVIGWAWVAAMATTAVSSLFIRQINDGAFSWIHLLSGWTLVALPMGIYAARRARISMHRRFMVGVFIGGLIIAGAFTFMPGRLMWSVFLG